jgi:hypothetical protein
MSRICDINVSAYCPELRELRNPCFLASSLTLCGGEGTLFIENYK